MFSKTDAITLCRQFIAELGKRGITIGRAYLFGSYASGNAQPYSDIDLALFSKSFNGVRYFDKLPFADIMVRYADLEPHTFREDDVTSSTPFVNEILRTGIRLS